MRNALLFTFILLLLAGLGTFAWVSNNPESPQLERAQDWPLVGGLARIIREAYLGQRTADDPDPAGDLGEATQVDVQSVGRDLAEDAGPMEIPDLTSEETKVVRTPEEQKAHDALIARLKRQAAGQPVDRNDDAEPIGGSSVPAGSGASPPVRPPIPDPVALAPTARSPPPVMAQEWRWFLPGHPVMDDSRAARLARLTSLAYLPVLSRDGGWLQVRYNGEDGWVDSSWQPEHSRRDARRGILRERNNPTMETNREHLRLAKKLMGVKKPWGEIGSWNLYTDVEDDELLELLSAAAEHTEDAFFARYGRVPSRSPTHAVLLFAKDADYREFSNETAEMPTVGHRGHAGQGLVAITTEGLRRREIASVLVHELTHLLIRRSLGWQLPTWLNEGLATDLGSVWVEDSSDLVLDRLVDDQDSRFGSYHSRLLYLEMLSAAGRLPSIQSVLARDRLGFYRGTNVGNSYAQSAAFVRYALDGEDGQMAAGFLEFLDLVAKGKRADLLELLGRDLPELEEGFRAWLAEEGERKRESLVRRQDAGRPANP